MGHFDQRLRELFDANPGSRKKFFAARKRGREYELRPKPLLPTLWAVQTISDAKKRARARNIDFDINAVFVLDMLERQEYRCAVSGIQFSDVEVNDAHKRPYMPSVDRIECSKGYTRDNVRIVCVAVNTMLQDWGDSVFHEIVCAYLAR